MSQKCDTDNQGSENRCSDAFFRMLCEHAGVAVVAAGADLRIRFWNRAAARMFGAAPERMLGTAFLSVISQEERAEAEQMLSQALSGGGIGEFEFCYRDAQGNRRRLAAVISPIVNDEGEIIGVSANIRDITRRVMLQEQVAQNRKMVSLGAMAGAMAHYFNNILGGVITSVDFALACDDPAMTNRVLGKTAHALARAAELGDSLLTFAEGDFRTADLADLTETFLETTEVLEIQLKGSGIELDVLLDPVPVTAVPGVQFKTVLKNVIRNAMEAMPDGGKLTLGLGPIEGGYLVSVRDTGYGVPEQLLDRIFEPFYSTKDCDGEGGESARPGLGLAVAHGIVQVMGGRITVESTVGEGAIFKITLPLNPKLPTRGT
ncbi:MAG: PAS domain S-box protein [Phycisphaerae bacterium]|nr:PAS domain S-box protein [Phycisphaerae bacterium]